MTNGERLTETIIGLLCDRKGFEEWWHNIGEDNRKDIRKKLTTIFNTTIISGIITDK